MTRKIDKKDCWLNIRTNRQKLDQLKALANAAGETLSSYMLRSRLDENTETPSCSICRQENTVLLNEIYHQVKKYGNPQLESTVRGLLREKDAQDGGSGNE